MYFQLNKVTDKIHNAVVDMKNGNPPQREKSVKFKWSEIIELLGIALMGIFFLAAGISEAKTYIESKKTIINTADDYELVSGVVDSKGTNTVEDEIRPNEYYYYKVDHFSIVFRNREGEKHHFGCRYDRNSTTRKLREGDKVKVLYLKEQPERADLAYFDVWAQCYAPMELYINGFIQSIRSIVCFGAAIAFLLVTPCSYYSEAKGKTKKNGKRKNDLSISQIKEKRGIALIIFCCCLFLTLIMIYPILYTLREYGSFELNELPKMIKDTGMGFGVAVAVVPTMVSFFYLLAWCFEYQRVLKTIKKAELK